MLNRVWPWFLVLSIAFAMFSGCLEKISLCIFSSLKETMELVISLIGIICFWSGMIKILINTSLIGKIKKILEPIINKIYKDENSNTKELIAVNMVSNMLGIGNAATPAGLRVIENMEKKQTKRYMSKSMNLFILMNSLSIQILPNTIMSIRMGQGDNNIGKVYFLIWIVSIITFFVIMEVGMWLFQE